MERTRWFKNLFDATLIHHSVCLDTETLHLDGTHSLAKKAGEATGYQHRKKGKTSNVLILTDGKGIPIALEI